MIKLRSKKINKQKVELAKPKPLAVKEANKRKLIVSIPLS